MREPQQAAPISSSLQQQEEASGLSRVSVSEGNRGNGPSLENGGTSGEAAGAGAPAGAPGAIAEGGRNGEKEDSGVGIMSAVGSMEGQEQADAGGVARDVQAAADHARAEEAAAAAAAAAAQQQREQQQQEQEQEQAAREQQRVLEEEQLRQQRVEQEERVQQQEQEQQAAEQQGLQDLQAGVDAAVAKHAAAYGYEHQPALAKSVDAVLPAVPKGNTCKVGISRVEHLSKEALERVKKAPKSSFEPFLLNAWPLHLLLRKCHMKF
eukprot:1152872-Pelagomonas_calceolata.AAC.12